MRFYSENAKIASRKHDNIEEIGRSLLFPISSAQGKEYAMAPKIQIVTNERKEELKEHGTYGFPLLVSDEALSRFLSGSFEWHWHREIELTLFTQGSMTYQINDQIFHPHAGQALFGNSNTLHSGHMEHGEDCRYISITFHPRLLWGYEGSLIQKPHAGQALFGNSNTLHSGHMEHGEDCRYISITFHPRLLWGYEGSLIQKTYVDPLLRDEQLSACFFDGSMEWHREAISLLTSMIQVHSLKKTGYEMDILGLLFQFWKLLYLHCPPSSRVQTGAAKKNQERIRQMLSFIHSSYQSDITLEDISRHIHICKSECCRIFKGYMKESLFEYLLKYRIEKSIPDVLEGRLSMTEIAIRAGFTDPNYFSKVFHKKMGCSPREYRRKRYSIQDSNGSGQFLENS